MGRVLFVILLIGGTAISPVVANRPSELAAAATPYDWLQFGGNAQHDGNDQSESTITPSNVANLRQLYRVELTTGAANDTPTNIDGSLVFLHGVSTSQGTKNLLIGNRKDGALIAFDAATGSPLWSHSTMPANCTQPETGEACHTTSSPAIDPSGQYVYAYGLDGYVHRYRVGDGTEATGGGWPELATKKPTEEKSAAALTIANSGGTNYLYVTNGGYPGDIGDYQGHITAINLTDGSQHVFNTMCSNQTVHFDIITLVGGTDCTFEEGAVWGRGGVVYNPGTQKIYFATGNGTYDANVAPAGHEWGDSVLALHPDGTGDGSGSPLDSYTPTNYLTLTQNDTDLGSTTPAILPLPAGCTGPHYGLQSGKDSQLRVLNLDNLSGQGGVGHTGGELASAALPQGGEMRSQIATWTDPTGNIWSFVTSDNGISAYEWTFGNCQLTQPQTDVINAKWHRSDSGSSSPLVANGVVFYAVNGALQALDPTTGNVLWQDSALAGITPLQNIHWESPIVVNGVVYITDGTGAHYDNLETDGHLLAYALPGATATATPSPTATSTATATATPVPCPAGWSCADVGGPALAGGQSLSGGTWTVQGAGGDIWGAADQFHFVWQTLAADGAVGARVISQAATDPYAKAGVMLRASTDPGSPFYAAFLTPGHGILVQYRTAQGATALQSAAVTGAPPTYLQVARSGSTYTAYTSTDGSSWTPIAGSTVTVGSSGAALAGMAVTSHNVGLLGSATFDTVSIGAAAPPTATATSSPSAAPTGTPPSTPTATTTPLPTFLPSSWKDVDIGSVGLAGSANYSGSTFTVSGSGMGICGAADAFNYVYQPWTGEGLIIARVAGQANTDSGAGAGVMVRESLSPTSTFAAMLMTPGNGTVFQRRTTSGGTCTSTAGPGVTAPYWVKLLRQGSTVTGYVSTDGANWTQVGTDTISTATATYIGLAVTAHTDAALSTANFDNVAVSHGQ